MAPQVVQPGQQPVGVLPYSSCVVLHSFNGFVGGATWGLVSGTSFLPPPSSLPSSLFRSRAAIALHSGLVGAAALSAFQLSVLTAEKLRMRSDKLNYAPPLAALAAAYYLAGPEDKPGSKPGSRGEKAAPQPSLTRAGASRARSRKGPARKGPARSLHTSSTPPLPPPRARPLLSHPLPPRAKPLVLLTSLLLLPSLPLLPALPLSTDAFF
ncbi:hypothetical protein TeGR_g14683 [Tetraparma gracilis]|uniref:Uncharacterized protein n=1 Tax=Tetraparma gracilis TaxID=2962635 RepID=A0ABQ6MNK3_9STRA|nr:hypothetical protein TeGR_g14683 [Tetraparma gracilis]